MGHHRLPTNRARRGPRRMASALSVLLVVGLLAAPAAGDDVSTGWSQVHGDGGNTLQSPAPGPSTPGVRWVRDCEEPTPAEQAFAPEGYQLAHRGGDGVAPNAADGVLMMFARNVAEGRGGVDLVGVDAATGEVR